MICFRDTKYFILENGSVLNGVGGNYLKPFLNRSGYYRVEMTNNNKRCRHYVHRLVAECYVSNPLNKPFVNHKNGIKTDNSVDNLEWCTHEENMRHAVETGLMALGKVGGPKLKYSKEDCLNILHLYESGVKQKEISKIYGCCNSSICRIIKLVRGGDFRRMKNSL